MEDMIFIKIIDLIEKETDIPLVEKNLNDWLSKSEINQRIYEIYEIASISKK